MIFILLGVALVGLIYYYGIKRNNYWKERGVEQGNPVIFFGHSLGTFLKKESPTEFMQKLYNSSNHRYLGVYQLTVPQLMIRDRELIKQITVKDFDHFQDHRSFVPENVEPLWESNLFQLQGQKWKNMRAIVSPTFTSSKMKSMFVLMQECAENFVDFFLRKQESVITVELKDIFTRYTNDVIASCAFGVRCDSLENRDNEFYVMGRSLKFDGTWQTLKLFLYMVFPSVMKIFKIRIFPKKVTDFFSNLVKETLIYREKNNIVRPDTINLLMEARKNGLKYEEENSNFDTGFATVQESEVGKIQTQKFLQLSDDEITGQALMFFFGGSESTSSQMCFIGYELGANPDVQEKLKEEIDETLALCNGKVTYEALVKMKYLDMVFSETLRKWPVGLIVERKVTKPYTIQPITAKEKPLHLNVGDAVWIPVYAIHHDEKYYPNPSKFDPERFNEENKKSMDPYTYLPFGAGPRGCIGSRFALLETKILLFHLINKFEIVPVEKTVIPLRLDRKTFSFTAADGYWFGLKRRTP